MTLLYSIFLMNGVFNIDIKYATIGLLQTIHNANTSLNVDRDPSG
jgi:hypothetical protein